MKKLLIILFAFALNVGAYAQNLPVSMTGTDTITDAGVVNLTQTVIGNYQTISIQFIVTKLSGTVGGTVVLRGSIDGTNYVAVNADDHTLTDVTTNTKVWTIEGSNYKYYKVICTGTGTMSAIASGKLFGADTKRSKHYVSTMKSDIDATSDTITDTGTGYVELQVKGSYRSVSIQAVSDKISGTAAGTITLQGSNDGINFVSVDTSYVQDLAAQEPYTVGGAGDNAFTVTDIATSTTVFNLNGSLYAYYRLSHTGTGTMVSRLRGYLMPSK